MEYLIYKSYYKNKIANESDLKFKIWKPSIFNLVPTGLPNKYIIYNLFRFFSIFKNSNYCAVLGYKDDKIVCSLLVVPSYFKWPFMKKNDVQLIYVKTYPEFRGQGYAKKMVLFTLNYLRDNKKIDDVWYVTDTNNVASQALAQNTFFKNDYFGRRFYIFGIKQFKGLTIK